MKRKKYRTSDGSYDRMLKKKWDSGSFITVCICEALDLSHHDTSHLVPHYVNARVHVQLHVLGKMTVIKLLFRNYLTFLSGFSNQN